MGSLTGMSSQERIGENMCEKDAKEGRSRGRGKKWVGWHMFMFPKYSPYSTKN